MINRINKQTVFVCIGTMKHSVDSFGPRLGTKLKENGFKVYGTIDDPINGINSKYKLPYIKEKHSNDFIVGIDASVCNLESKFDKIIFKEKPIKPGKALNKVLPEIGDMCIIWNAFYRGNMEGFFDEDITRTELAVDRAYNIILERIKRNG